MRTWVQTPESIHLFFVLFWFLKKAGYGDFLNPSTEQVETSGSLGLIGLLAPSGQWETLSRNHNNDDDDEYIGRCWGMTPNTGLWPPHACMHMCIYTQREHCLQEPIFLFFVCFEFFFFESLTMEPGWPGTHYIAHSSLEFTIPLPQVFTIMPVSHTLQHK